MSEKKWLVDRYINRIVHRAPKPEDTTGHYVACDSWEEARSTLIELRGAELVEAEKKYNSARHRLSKAKMMQRKAPL